MKTVFPNRMVPHIWAQQNQPEGRGSNLFFDGPTIYSYGRHFPIASYVINPAGERAVLFTSRRYSVTTSKHIAYVRGSWDTSLPVFYVENASADYLPYVHAENMRVFRADVVQQTEKAYRANKRYRADRIDATLRAVAKANEYAAFFQLAERIEAPSFSDEMIATARETQRVAAAKELEKRKERDRIAALDAAESLIEWLSGRPANLHRHYSSPVALRCIDGETLETSKGATVPMTHARRVFAFIKQVRESGNAWARNGKTVRVGHFQVDSVDVTGDIKAGCHDIQWTEIARFAKAHGFFDMSASSDAVEVSA